MNPGRRLLVRLLIVLICMTVIARAGSLSVAFLGCIALLDSREEEDAQCREGHE